ncbi:hypothetical protein D3C83_21910 [compost metagenome]
MCPTDFINDVASACDGAVIWNSRPTSCPMPVSGSSGPMAAFLPNTRTSSRYWLSMSAPNTARMRSFDAFTSPSSQLSSWRRMIGSRTEPTMMLW